MRTILVTGSTGTIGSRTVARLASMPGVRVRAAVHDHPFPAAADKIEEVHVDFAQPETLRAAMRDIDVLFMITPSVPNQVDLAERLVEAAVDERVPRVVRLSAVGADRAEPITFMREHADIERLLSASGIHTTFLRPQSYMNNFITYWRPDADGNICLPWGDAGVGLIDARDVADIAAQLLVSEAQTGAAYTLTGPAALSGDEIAASISDASGRWIRYLDLAEDELRTQMLTHGMLPVVGDPLLELFAACKAGQQSVLTDTVAELTGRPPIDFRQFAHDHAPAWKA